MHEKLDCVTSSELSSGVTILIVMQSVLTARYAVIVRQAYAHSTCAASMVK